MGLEEKHVFKAFLCFYKSVYNETLTNKEYEEKHKQECASFIKLLENQYQYLDRVGVDFLWLYFNFQFQRLALKIENEPDKRITVKMTIGKMPFNRFVNRDTSLDFLTIQKSSTFDKKQFIEIVNLQSNNQKKSRGYDADDLYREQLLNTDKGLSNCIIYTSLYHPDSENCQKCRFQKECISTQKQMYRKIYRDRKIDGNKTTTG